MRCNNCKRGFWTLPAAYAAYILVCPICGNVCKNALSSFIGKPKNAEERNQVINLMEAAMAWEIRRLTQQLDRDIEQFKRIEL